MIVDDVERWKRLSPRLDELLELAPPERAERLASIGLRDPDLAAELTALIGESERAERADFLAGRAADAAALLGADSPTLAGTPIGGYVLEAPLGQGGAGAVWRARRADLRFRGAVAIKLLHPSLIGRTGARRFEREGAILARLAHPHIARLLDAGVTAGGQPYLVLELVDGRRIDHHCDARRLRIDERIALFHEVLEAVAHAHRHLVIHRDIKPSNILVGDDGTVKLLDFGIAKLLQADDESPATDLTGERGAVLTPEYAAPEQLRGEEVTTATDVYALGVLLYQVLSGQHPTAAPNASAAHLMRATLDQDPCRLSTVVTASRSDPETISRVAAERDTSVVRLRRQLGGDLENIVAKALRKVPGERYATVDAFADDLRRWAAGEPVSARPDSLLYRTSRFVDRHRGAVAAGALTMLAIVAGLVGTITQARRAAQQAAIATLAAEEAREQRDLAIEQQRMQRGTSEFMQLLMRDAAAGEPGKIRKQLDRAVTLLDRTRFELPIVKVALMRQTAGRYVEIGDVQAGADLLRKAIASVEGTELARPPSTVPVSLACSLARYLHEMNDLPGATAELDRADALIAAGAQLSVPSRSECDVQRSYIATSVGDYGAGIAILRKVLQDLAAAGVHDGEQPRVVRSALSRALLASGDTRGAMAIAKPLLDESIGGQGLESIAVLRRSSVVTSATRLGGDPLAALAMSERDRARARRLLGDGRVDAAIELEHGRILLELGRDLEAAETSTRAAAAALATGQRVLLLPAQLGAVEALVRAGRVSEAADRLASFRTLRDKAPVPEQIDALRIEALLAAANGNTEGAQRALADARRLLERAGRATHPLTFALAMAEGERALATGRSDAEALASADRAVAAARRGSTEPSRSSNVGRAMLLKAGLERLAGRAELSRADAAAARDQLAPTLGATHPAAMAAARLASGTS